MTKKRRSSKAVSEVVGVILLLGITLGLFGFLNYIVFSFSVQPSAPSVNLIGSIDKTTNTILIEHNGGDSLDEKTVIILANENGIFDSFSLNEFSGFDDDTDIKPSNNRWNFGETVQYYYGNIPDGHIQVTVVDPDSNTLILSVLE